MPGKTKMTSVHDSVANNDHRLAHTVTAHDWDDDRRKRVYDDGTMSYFWRAHTITVLFIFTAILLYVTLFDGYNDPTFNTKRGLVAVMCTFLLFGVTQTPDGPLYRPHPAFWRLIQCLSIVYELILVFMLFQTVDDARQLLTHVDASVGRPLPEKSYGGNCRIYDPDNAQPFHNLFDKMDGFVPVHFFGWWLKTLILRDYWLCTVFSIMFEILEYTLEHQLPNFSECWWDHWFMDVIICNGFGIFCGMKTLEYLSIKTYHWRGMWNIPSYGGKLKRMMTQFTPYSWTEFDWRPFSSLRRWFAMLGVIAIFLLAELNTFYMKFVLWLPPEHFLCLGRLVFFLFMGAAAMRETFQYLDDPNCKEFGRQSWIIAAIIITEFLLTIKFDYELITKPLPLHMTIFWVLAIVGLVIFTVWKFYIKRDVKNDLPLDKGSATALRLDHLYDQSPLVMRDNKSVNNEPMKKQQNGRVQRNGPVKNNIVTQYCGIKLSRVDDVPDNVDVPPVVNKGRLRQRKAKMPDRYNNEFIISEKGKNGTIPSTKGKKSSFNDQ